MDFRILYSVPSDYPQRWERWIVRFKLRGRGSVKRVKALRITGKVIVVLFVLLYVLLAWACMLATPAAFIAYGASTAVCFVAMSLFRKWRDEPRPYEVFSMKPLVPKKNRESGKSFPSRHTFSAFLIATIAAVIFRSFGGALILLLAAVLACIRVLEGVHFPRDVVAGAVLGILAGMLCVAALTVAVA